MSINHSIFYALRQRLSTFTPAAPLNGPIPILHPGSGGEPPAAQDALWIECKLFPSEPRGNSKSGPLAIYTGYMQAMCLTRFRASAFHETSLLADQVAALFPEAGWLAHDGVRVQIASPPGIQTSFEEDGKLKMPVIVRYQALE